MRYLRGAGPFLVRRGAHPWLVEKKPRAADKALAKGSSIDGLQQSGVLAVVA
jgi:hypothetical protein